MMNKTALRLLPALALLLLLPTAQAHKLAPSLLTLQETASDQFAVHWKTPKVMASATPIRPVLPPHCREQSQPQPKPDPVGSVWEWTINCSPEGLVGKELGVSGLRENKSAVLVSLNLLDKRQYRVLLNVDKPAYTVPERAQRIDVLWEYLRLGVSHILEGVDHLFFVWSLILLLPLRRLLWAVTAFTLGHSVTLALAALEIIQVPQTLTEILIALSILVMANELAQRSFLSNKLSGQSSDQTTGQPESSFIQRNAYLVCIGFGLLHGLGFASALSEIGLPQEELVTALLAFNVGVEVGQIAFIIVVLAVGLVLKRLAGPLIDKLRWVPAYLIGSAAAFWCIERTLSL